MAPDLRTRLGNVELPNPILTASGCASSGRELAQFIDVSKIGAVVTKSVMLGPRAGRPTSRMAETPSGMLNSIGLQGPGIDSFLQRDLPWLLSRGARAVVSIAGSTIDEYAELAARLSDAAGVTGDCALGRSANGTSRRTEPSSFTASVRLRMSPLSRRTGWGPSFGFLSSVMMRLIEAIISSMEGSDGDLALSGIKAPTKIGRLA